MSKRTVILRPSWYDMVCHGCRPLVDQGQEPLCGARLGTALCRELAAKMEAGVEIKDADKTSIYKQDVAEYEALRRQSQTKPQEDL